MKEFGPHNYSYFFKVVNEGEVFSYRDAQDLILSVDTVKGIALLQGFTIEGLPNCEARAKKTETVKFEVELNAFQEGAIREVVVDKNDLTGNVEHDLELIFKFGQNDFQPVQQRCSVSCGDVIRFNGQRYEVATLGFKKVA